MNYITEIKAFHDMVQDKQLSTGQIALWYALMYINNKCAWIEWFKVSNIVLELNCGLSRSGILKARNVLKQYGIIDFKSATTKATTYKLITMSKSVQASTQDGVQASTLLNKHKLKTETETINYQLIADMYNETCISFPVITKLSDARKKSIKARINSGYTEDDFKKLFTLAEQSTFLKGGNNRNWQANFDWLITDSNMAKVLDGNYINQAPAQQGKPIQQSKNGNIFMDMLEEEGIT